MKRAQANPLAKKEKYNAVRELYLRAIASRLLPMRVKLVKEEDDLEETLERESRLEHWGNCL